MQLGKLAAQLQVVMGELELVFARFLREVRMRRKP